MERALDKKLFNCAMRADWKSVIEEYKNESRAHMAKITKTEDTALHIAISDGQEDVVEELVQLLLSAGHAMGALQLSNETGDTPLHFAASMGNVRMCRCIAKVDPSLTSIRNHDGETPIFLAALHGRKAAFLLLHSLSVPDLTQRYRNCRREDGDTVLHCAIVGEYFDLAFQIIKLYEDLVDYVNEKGFSPLHILATKPSAFKSGSNLGRWKMIIYHCIFVDPLQPDPPPDDGNSTQNPTNEQDSSSYPQNWKTCVGFFNLLFEGTIKVVKAGKMSERRQRDAENPPEQGTDSIRRHQGHQLVPPNYLTCFHFLKLISKAMLVILGLGIRHISEIQEKKEKHTWSAQVMNELLECAKLNEYDHNGRDPQLTEHKEMTPYHFFEGEMSQGPEIPMEGLVVVAEEMAKRETPILIATKNGVTEMVERILELFPVAIHDMNEEKKNVVLLAVENRQPHVYKLLLKRKIHKDSVFRKEDHEGNSALHLAAKLGDYKPWLIPGAALQMQWEIKWYEYVKSSMPPHFFVRYNKKMQTPRDIFTSTHADLLKSGGEWLTNTSESCSVVAALIATVAFATSSTVPGGNDQNKGTPILENQPAFAVFAISSLIALCFSVTSVVMFLAILTSRYEEKDFGTDLPRKLLVGLTSLFVSIAAMLVSFCAGHFFVLKDKLKYAAFPVYAITCLPVSFFAIVQFPLYFDLIWATFKKVPQRSYNVSPF